MLGVREDELRDALRLRPVERVGPRAVLDVVGSPERRPGPVHVVAADVVLVDAAVAVVVDAFRAQQQPVTLQAALVIRHALHDARVVLADAVRALSGDVLAHHGDVPVAVEVVGSVLVEQPVAVVVGRPHAGP